MTSLRLFAFAVALGTAAHSVGVAADQPASAPVGKKLPLISVPDREEADPKASFDKPIAWDAGGRFEHSLSLPPGKVAEVCGKLAKGQAVAWTFKADRPLDFNVHFHAGKQVVFPEKKDAIAAAQGRLEVGVDQDYCWMWTNTSAAAVRLTLTMAR